MTSILNFKNNRKQPAQKPFQKIINYISLVPTMKKLETVKAISWNKNYAK